MRYIDNVHSYAGYRRIAYSGVVRSRALKGKRWTPNQHSGGILSSDCGGFNRSRGKGKRLYGTHLYS